MRKLPGSPRRRVAGPDTGHHAAPDRLRHRPRCRSPTSRPTAGVLLPIHAYPLIRERPAGGQRLDPRRAPGPDRRAVVAVLQRGGGAPTPTPGCAEARTPSRDHGDRAGQPHGRVPLPQAVHGQPAGRPGRRLHLLLGRGGPRGRGARGPLGVPPGGGRRRTTTGSSPSAPNSTARRPSAGRGPGPGAGRGGRRRPRARSTCTRASRAWSRWPPASWACPSDDPARPLTLTGGLTFGGGPGNNYTTHGIAAMVTALRADPGAVGLVTGLGWYATKHAVGVLASRPPGRAGFPGRERPGRGRRPAHVPGGRRGTGGR